MISAFHYAIFSFIHFPALGGTMRHQGSEDNQNSTITNFLGVIFFILIVIFAISFNYLVIDFLF